MTEEEKTEVTVIVRGGVVETAFVKGGVVRLNVIDCDTQDEAELSELDALVANAQSAATYTTTPLAYEPNED